MKYFDSHAHYYDDRFSEAGQTPVFDLLDTLFSDEVLAVVNVGTSPQTARAAIRQAHRYPRMKCALGIHPTDGQGLADIDAALREIERLIVDPASKCVALGEIGLDYHYPDTDRELQRCLFEKQMRLAARLDLPVVIHDRDAHGDVMDMIAAHPNVCGVLHSFSGSAEMARELVRRGWMLSFSGTVTFKNARKVAEACAAVPMDRVLIETDCPYLSPHPLRGTINHSGNLSYTNAAVAALHGIDPDVCARMTAENAMRLFRISDLF